MLWDVGYLGWFEVFSSPGPVLEGFNQAPQKQHETATSLDPSRSSSWASFFFSFLSACEQPELRPGRLLARQILLPEKLIHSLGSCMYPACDMMHAWNCNIYEDLKR